MAAASNTVLTWDVPHRLWHASFGGAICVSLFTGLDGSIDAMDLHIGCGVLVLALLLFRAGWAIWGGPYERLRQYRTSPRAILGQFRRRSADGSPHTPAGAAMALTMFVCALAQAGSGLFASDDIVTDGPFVHRVSSAAVELATSIHTRLYWVVLALVALHVTALAWYAVRRDPVPGSMLTGRMVSALPPITGHYWLRAAVTALAAAAIVWTAARWA